MAAWLILLLILIPYAGAIGVLLARNPRLQTSLAVATALLAALSAFLLLPYAGRDPVLSVSIAGTMAGFVPDGMGLILALIAAGIGCLTVIFSVEYMRGEAQLGRYYALVLIFIGAMSALVLTDNLLLLLIFWEITALCSYALISFHNDDPKAVEGGIRALIVTQLGGIGLLVGVLLIFAHTGSYQMSVFLSGASRLPPSALSLIAFCFLFAAAAKSAQVPFHIWLPGAMEAPTPISALIHAATMVNAGVYLLARFYPAFAGVEGWTQAVITVGAVSALAGALMALYATDLKRVLAYSTISQLGFMVFAVGSGAIFASQLHLLSHAVFKALLFLGAGAVIHATGTRDLTKMGGLGRKMPFVRLTFCLGALALAGIPITNGFWSKELILEGGFEHAPAWSAWLMLVVAGLTALYTVRLVWLVFFGEPRAELHAHDATVTMQLPLGLLSIGTLTTWLLAPSFAALLRDTLPFHTLADETGLFTAIAQSPVTLVALVVIALGVVLWFVRLKLARFTSAASGLSSAARADFGFAWLSRRVTTVTLRVSTWSSALQTGQLNWNIVQLVGGFIVVALVLALGGIR